MPNNGTAGTLIQANLAGMLPTAAVTIAWNTSFNVCTGTTGVFGNFQCTFNVPTAGAGAYTLKASDGADLPTAIFTVNPSASVSPSSDPAGSWVVASGHGFSSNSAITVKFAGVTVCTTTSNGIGGFSCTFETFATAAEFPSQFVNISDASGHTASFPFTVTFPGTATGTFYGTSSVALPALAARSCDVPLTSGVCTANGIIPPGGTEADRDHAVHQRVERPRAQLHVHGAARARLHLV